MRRRRRELSSFRVCCTCEKRVIRFFHSLVVSLFRTQTTHHRIYIDKLKNSKHTCTCIILLLDIRKLNWRLLTIHRVSRSPLVVSESTYCYKILCNCYYLLYWATFIHSIHIRTNNIKNTVHRRTKLPTYVYNRTKQVTVCVSVLVSMLKIVRALWSAQCTCPIDRCSQKRRHSESKRKRERELTTKTTFAWASICLSRSNSNLSCSRLVVRCVLYMCSSWLSTTLSS